MKGILFKPDMIQAIRDKRKTVTRRVIKPQPKGNMYPEMLVAAPCDIPTGRWVEMLGTIMIDHKPRYQVGETVYIKEAFRYIQGGGEVHDFGVWYKLDGEYKWWRDNGGIMNYPINEKNRSPLFMPVWAARYFIKITGVSAGRVQEITDEDALAEGVYGDESYEQATPVMCYEALWDSINKDYQWESNPWVFRYEFEVLEKSD